MDKASYWYGKYSAAADFYILMHKGMLEERPFTLVESNLLDKIKLHGEFSYNAYLSSGGKEEHERPWTCPEFLINMMKDSLSETDTANSFKR